MGTARASLISFLAVQHLLSPERFAGRFSDAWLVWEAGADHVPTGGSKQTLSSSAPSGPQGGDALCFELKLALGETAVMGRQAGSALVVNDATFSRQQYVFARSGPDQYTVALAVAAQPATLDGAPLGATPHRLRPGAELKAGEVVLHFYDVPGFSARLALGDPTRS
jgi:hypothetical protein